MDILGTLGMLGRASLQGAVVIAAAWIVCRLIPRLPASVRCGLWWLACAKLVMGLVWAEPVRLAVLPAERPMPAVTSPPRPPSPIALPAPGRGGREAASFWLGGGAPLPVEGGAMGEGLGVRSWPSALLTLWATGVLLLLGVTLGQHRRARRVVRRAAPVEEPWLSGLFSSLRDRLGAPRRTDVRLSAEIETPQVLGLLRPVVLLPAAAPGRLSRPEMAMTLCHELLHVRRGDLWLGWVPALAQRLFFFHPLVLLAAREYALAREAACDADVLRVLDPAPETYGRLLLRLGVSPQTPRLAAAGAAPSFQILKRRLQMLQHASGKKRLHPAWWALVALGAVVALIPFTITAQESREPLPPVAAVAAPEDIPPVPPASPAAPVAPLPVARIAQESGHRIPPVPPVPPRPPVPPVPPHASHRDRDEPFILLLGKDRTVMNGSTRDIERARKLRKSDDEQLLWFEHRGKSYVVRDAATLNQVKALFEPQSKLGEQQAALGEKQAQLGSQQAALGAKQAAQGAKQAAVGTKMAKVAAEQAHLAGQDKNSASLEAEMQELERQQQELEKPQADLSHQQEELGRQQEVLGRQQEELGKKQEELGREADRQLQALVDKVIANGIAQEVK